MFYSKVHILDHTNIRSEVENIYRNIFFQNSQEDILKIKIHDNIMHKSFLNRIQFIKINFFLLKRQQMDTVSVFSVGFSLSNTFANVSIHEFIVNTISVHIVFNSTEYEKKSLYIFQI